MDETAFLEQDDIDAGERSSNPRLPQHPDAPASDRDADSRATSGFQAQAAASSGRPSAASESVDLGPISVTRTLLGQERLPRAVLRALYDAEEDISRGRFESALDLTMQAEAAAPDFLPLFVRHAELLVATGRRSDALRLAATVSRLATLRREPGYDLDLARVIAHGDPRTENVVSLAAAALDAARFDLVRRYVPVAVTRLATEGDFTGALELASRWRDAEPENATALYVHVRELLRAGDVATAIELARSTGDDPAGAVAALAAATAAGSPDRWERLGGLMRSLRDRKARIHDIHPLLEGMADVVPDGRLTVELALVDFAAQRFDETLQRLRVYRPIDDREAFVVFVSMARASLAIADEATAITEYREAFALSQDPRVAAFAESLALFDPPATTITIGSQLAALLKQRGAIADATGIYASLLELDPENDQLARDHAEALGLSGQRTAALKSLDALLKRQEAAGQREAAQRTLRSMVAIAPSNVSLRSRLVETYLRRGRVNEAVGELFIVAQLLERKGRIPEAIGQLRRAGEIASLTRDWSKVHHIFTYMVRLQPEDLGLRHAAAATFLQHGQIGPAIEQLREVVDLAVKQEEPDEAIAALHQMIALAPQDPEPYHRLGELLASVGEYGQAERVYRRLATLLPDDPAVQAKQRALAALARGSV